MEQSADCVKAGNFKLMKMVGAGCFGVVYSANSIKTNEEVAMKLENNTDKMGQLQYESQIMQKFKGESKLSFCLLVMLSWISLVHLVWAGAVLQLLSHDNDGPQP